MHYSNFRLRNFLLQCRRQWLMQVTMLLKMQSDMSAHSHGWDISAVPTKAQVTSRKSRQKEFNRWRTEKMLWNTLLWHGCCTHEFTSVVIYTSLKQKLASKKFHRKFQLLAEGFLGVIGELSFLFKCGHWKPVYAPEDDPHYVYGHIGSTTLTY